MLDEQGLLNPELSTAPADVLVIPMVQDLYTPIALAEQLRAAGLKVQFYGENKKFKQKMAYANKLGVPFVVLLGEDELAQGVCSVKDMRTGQQVSVNVSEAAVRIKAAMAQVNVPVILEK